MQMLAELNMSRAISIYSVATTNRTCLQTLWNVRFDHLLRPEPEFRSS